MHRVGLVLRELLLTLGQLADVHEDPQPPENRFVSRLIMLSGAGLTGLVAYLTGGVVRVLTVALTVVAAVSVWAYYDHRTETRAAARR
ncbi:hypothetical protein [Streptomyces cahuitamycinicus]|uniref:hypothetical protein n=1 Tax=Streptomyces cahuitamycinicus TaxID=2070367 RepID=UPI0015E06753|nr:hypothetical protein [Streptomyces cahuitamycinicus]